MLEAQRKSLSALHCEKAMAYDSLSLHQEKVLGALAILLLSFDF